ncbi:conserved exported hypothetical protein [Burkholderiales bacterium]|nr:conserved exported hypothetical protein [Burkholderiales bacterium]
MRFAKGLLPVLLLLSACSTVQVGRNFDLAAFEARVQRGVSTRNDVRGWLGAPTGIGVSLETNGDRFEQWTYYAGEGDLPNLSDAHLKLLQIKFDQQGVVRAYNWSGEAK